MQGPRAMLIDKDKKPQVIFFLFVEVIEFISIEKIKWKLTK